MQFVHQSLTWGFLLALVPLAIHLINLVRRRRIQWGAMDFLLQSYRKHRTSILLQQWLLLLLRMAAVALLVAMLAQWVTQREWFALFGRTATHHFILIDDSYSMSDRSSGTTAFDRAEQAFANIVTQAKSQETRQKVTLLRWSHAVVEADSTRSVGAPDLNAEPIDSQFDAIVAEARRGLSVTELAVGPRAALFVTKQLLGERQDENSLVYLLSDFRKKEWENPAELQSSLQEIADAGAQIHFVDCSEKPVSNLTLVDVRPAEETRAAGVPLFVDIRVQNTGPRVERKIPVQLRTRVYDPTVVAASRPGENVFRREEPPAVLIDEIQPGQSVTARAQVYFPVPGDQVIEASLPEDAISADNRRWCVVDLPEGEPVLVVDGSEDQRHSYYVTSAFNPGQLAATGIQPGPVRTPAFLRDTTAELLAQYRAIYLLDVPRLDDRALDNLATFVRSGGGLAIFVGDNVNWAFYRDRFYDDGQGLFPLPLDSKATLPAELFENTPDLEVQDHPIFSAFFGDQNPLIRWVRVENYIRPISGWLHGADTKTEVLSKLRNGDPLVVSRPFGEGRVVACLTTAAPQWNNWANDPSFVVVMLKLHAYLAAPLRRIDPHVVGAPIEISIAEESHRPDVSFVTPRSGKGNPLVIAKTATPKADSSATLVASLSREISADSGSTDLSGIYEAWVQELAGPIDVRRFAVNVDPAEGSLDKETGAVIVERLTPVTVQYHQANEYTSSYGDHSAANRSLLLMCLLLGALVGEQVLAHFTSFHPSRRGVR